jgi:predicted AlkP superfamily pyrophosphatase or phosphodiesterase
VVLIVVDQMRADYVERFRGDWTGGLHRLIRDGAWFSNAAFPYSSTVTCPGHATIATGALPHQHGIMQNTWWDRAARRMVTCTDDSEVTTLRYPTGTAAGASARRLLLPTFADELRVRNPEARVVTIALKARSAIMLAGRGGDAVTWMSESYEHWETSTAYGASRPAPVESWLAAYPVDADFGRTWTLALAPERYTTPDEGEGEAPPSGWTGLFPHVLSGDASKTPNRTFRGQWARSPLADAYVGRLAAALTERFSLGADAQTDFLGVSFSSPDLVGHAFGPDSQEVQDIYAHLDATVGALLESLDKSVGRDRYVVALTADHGVAQIPDQLVMKGQDAGRASATRIGEQLERAAQAAAAGAGSYIARVNTGDVYFTPGSYEELAKVPAALDAVVSALGAQPGVARVFRREELVGGRTSADPMLRAAALSYVPRLSGDLVYALKPGWISNASGTTHGTVNSYDQRVPIILMGRGIRSGDYRDAVTPADVAPSLAALTGVTMTRAQGQVLHAALASSR